MRTRDVLRLHDQLPTPSSPREIVTSSHTSLPGGMAEALLDHDRRAVLTQLGERAPGLGAIVRDRAGRGSTTPTSASGSYAEDPLELRVDLREAAVDGQHRHPGVDVLERAAEVVQQRVLRELALALLCSARSRSIRRTTFNVTLSVRPMLADQHLLLGVERLADARQQHRAGRLAVDLGECDVRDTRAFELERRRLAVARGEHGGHGHVPAIEADRPSSRPGPRPRRRPRHRASGARARAPCARRRPSR